MVRVMLLRRLESLPHLEGNFSSPGSYNLNLQLYIIFEMCSGPSQPTRGRWFPLMELQQLFNLGLSVYDTIDFTIL